jgi:2,3-bisphosphoglycerate-independent phosphoglycerate mutase
VAFADRLKASGKVAHVMGLVSDGGVHGHIVHIQAALKTLADRGVRTVLHAITDGRDVAPKSGAGYMRDLIGAMPQGVTIGTVCGRYYAMDRDNRWERVETAYRAMVQGVGVREDDAVGVIEAAYASAVTDEFVPATVLGGYAGMADGDGVFCLNFRADRAREILAAMGDPAFDGFDVSGRPALDMLGMETEKYPHVTFFLNGGIEVPEVGEDRYMAPSPKVATYDLQPEMSAAEVTDAFVGAITQQYDLIVCNYANPDMVGHTGDIGAAVKACEAVDAGLGRVLAALEAVGGAMIVTADHGNCETMIDPETGGPHTAHTTNPVPVALVGGPKGARLHNGRLADLAPTLLGLMGLELPPEMTGESLIE